MKVRQEWLVDFAAVLLVLPGCSRQPSDLERRVERVEQRVTNLHARVGRLIELGLEDAALGEAGNSNAMRWMESMDRLADVKWREFEKRLDDRETVFKIEVAAELERHLQARAAQFKAGARPAAPAPAPGVRAAEPLRDGVYEQIAGQAAKDWPGNFTMQNFVIQEQLKSYRVLHPAR